MPTFDFVCEVCGYEGRSHRKDKPPRFCSRKCQANGTVDCKPRKYFITTAMAEEIERVYLSATGKNEVNELAARLKLPRWKISRYAIQRGWVKKCQKEPDWTERELNILGQSAHRGLDAIQRRLKKAGFTRSITGIQIKRKRMRFLKNMNGQSGCSLAECFGVDFKTVQRWIRLGYLRTDRRGTNRLEVQGGDIFYIKDAWVKEFVINCVDIIDFRKVDKWWLVDLLIGAERPANSGTGIAYRAKSENK